MFMTAVSSRSNLLTWLLTMSGLDEVFLSRIKFSLTVGLKSAFVT